MIHLKTKTTYSLRKSVTKPDELIEACKAQGAESIAITETGNIFSFVKFYKKCLKEKIKPIIGVDLVLNEPNFPNLTLLCKNQKGFSDLLKIIAKSNSKDNYNLDRDIATISLEQVAELSHQNFIVYAGCLGSLLSKQVTNEYNKFVKSKTYEEAKALICPEWKQNLDGKIALLKDMFGKSNLFLENQDVEVDSIPAASIMSKIITDASNRLDIQNIGTCKPYYLKKTECQDQRIMICIDKKTNLNNIESLLETEEDTEYYSFLRNDSCYLLNNEECNKLYSPQIVENNAFVASQCEQFNILNNPKIPSYNCPDNLDANSYLKRLCDESFHKVPNTEQYKNRLTQELKIIVDVGLSSYFLIVRDIANYATSKGWLSTARGSAGGCIVSYLLGITEADPVLNDLYFSRFYNEGRNQPGKISLPDIDLDVPIVHRKDMISFVRHKYGKDKTGSIATFGSLKGSAALKEVLRMRNACSADEANVISKLIIDEHKISDELEELKKSGEEASILGWSIDNVKALHQYVDYDDNGELIGDYAKYFKQAIKLENCKKTLGRHAGGLVVSDEPISNYCPMVNDRNGDELMIGVDMHDCEAVGGLKMDILGSAQLDDNMECIRLIREGDVVRN